MALTRTTKMTLGIVGGTILLGGAVYAVYQSGSAPKKKKKKKEDQELPPGDDEPPPMGDGGDDDFDDRPPRQPLPPSWVLLPDVVAQEPVFDEPLGGWKVRWDAVKEEMIRSCRRRVGATEGLQWSSAWTELWRCIAQEAFPETARRLPFNQWPQWLRSSAAAQIRADVSDALSQEGVSTQGWTFMLWLRFGGVIEGCYDALAPHEEAIIHCVASEIYPDEEWPPNEEGWKADFWRALRDEVRTYADLQEGRGLPSTYEQTLPLPPG